MKPTAQSGGAVASNATATPDLATALDQLWARFLPEIRQRVNILQGAAVACTGNQLSTEQRTAAHAAAHKLAGTLGTFNLAHGSDLARQFELVFGSEESPSAELSRNLADLAGELSSVIESRKTSALGTVHSLAPPPK
ncbi:MAG TPA: Hpt domain-containing protein [Terracidiphilus sp.]|jgi:HPt (histidine-containing phosphotransfer) domain-containing protein|nr:Hpt domain-containing protein [Terracidiphilus sp.]